MPGATATAVVVTTLLAALLRTTCTETLPLRLAGACTLICCGAPSMRYHIAPGCPLNSTWTPLRLVGRPWEKSELLQSIVTPGSVKPDPLIATQDPLTTCPGW